MYLLFFLLSFIINFRFLIITLLKMVEYHNFRWYLLFLVISAISTISEKRSKIKIISQCPKIFTVVWSKWLVTIQAKLMDDLIRACFYSLYSYSLIHAPWCLETPLKVGLRHCEKKTKKIRLFIISTLQIIYCIGVESLSRLDWV